MQPHPQCGKMTSFTFSEKSKSHLHSNSQIIVNTCVLARLRLSLQLTFEMCLVNCVLPSPVYNTKTGGGGCKSVTPDKSLLLSGS